MTSHKTPPTAPPTPKYFIGEVVAYCATASKVTKVQIHLDVEAEPPIWDVYYKVSGRTGWLNESDILGPVTIGEKR